MPHSSALHGFGEIGVVLLLGVAVLEVGLDRLTAAGWAGVAVAALGIVVSVAGGYAIGWLYGAPSDEALFLGLALGATSIGITVQVLEQFGLMGHRAADVLLAAAVIDDVIALYLLGAAHGFLSDGMSGGGALVFVAWAIIVLGGLFVLCHYVTAWASRHRILDSRARRGVWIVTAVALGAWLTHSLDLSSVVGAFFAGLGIGEGLSDERAERSVKDLQPGVLLLMPFFFVMIGVQAQWDVLDEPALLWLVLGLIGFAVVSKTLGGVLGAIRIGSWRDRWFIGFGMVARGEVGLIIASIGLAQGHLSYPVFVALVLTIIVVSVLGPLLMVPLAKGLCAQRAIGATR